MTFPNAWTCWWCGEVTDEDIVDWYSESVGKNMPIHPTCLDEYLAGATRYFTRDDRAIVGLDADGNVVPVQDADPA